MKNSEKSKKVNDNTSDKVWHDIFIKALKDRHPNRPKLVLALMELLDIGREAVYRRLRNDVEFSFFEIIKIAKTWNISLDGIIGVNSEQIPFFMQPVNYIDPSKQELNFLRNVIQSINSFKDFPDVEFMNICNKLPRQLLAGFKYLNRFYLFKWKYQYGNEKKSVPFSKVVISEDQRKLTADYYSAIKNVPHSIFIFDYMLFDYLINDIRYFHTIELITAEEKELIKKDLYSLLDYLSELATTGFYHETQKKVIIHISHLNVDTNYSYTYTNQINMCFVHVFDKYEIYTYDPKMMENFRTWIQLKKRTSFQITEVNQKGRIEYFTIQRQLIDTL